MKTFYGNYLGVVITGGEKDPEGRGRTQVFIPNIMPALYELWNKEGEDISFDVIGQGLEGEINPEVYKRLQQILPWAECAAPIIGASPSYKPNILGQASEALRNVGRAVVDTAKEALNTLTGGDVTAATPSGDQAGNLAISNEIAKGRYASGKCGTAVGNEVMVKMYGYSDKEVRAASPDGRRDGKNYNEICKNLGWTAVPISKPEDAPVGSIISYGGTSENSYGHVEAVGQNAKGQKTYLFGLGEISSPGGGSRVGARNKKGFQGVAWIPPADRQAQALKKVGLSDKTASAYPNPSPTTGMTPDPGTSGKNEQQLAASLNQEIAGAQQLSLQSAEATASQSFGSLDGVSSSARSSFSGGGGSTSTTSFKGNQSATPSPTPITTYSVGKSVGGTDETQDKWTNKGYTSTGKNLTPGCVAVDTKVYPLGTVFKDNNTGKVYIATDRHGNKNPNVVDVYVPPSQYKGQSGSMNLAVIDTIPKSQIPKTSEGVQSFLSQYGEVPPGESATNFLEGKNEGVTENLAVESTQPSVKNPTEFQGTAGPNTNNQALGMFGYASEGQAVWIFFREGNPLFPVYFAASYGQKEWQNMYGHASPGVGAGITKTNPQADGKFPASPEAAQTGALPGTT
jgi:3D (Asp-Asp-Asp) domain-containing protein